MYRRYLCCLEDRISNLSDATKNIVCFHSYRHSWFEDNIQAWASFIAIALVFLIYFGLAWSVSTLVKKLWIFDFWMIFLFYVAIGIISFAVAIILLRNTPEIYE